MKELQEIIKAYGAARQHGLPAALATVVQVDGSSYRRPGARMLVTGDGRFTGAISGGCLEGDVLRKAQLAMVQQQPMLVTYDTTDEDDTQFGMQLGCNGVVHILIEPVSHEDPDNPLLLLQSVLASRQTAVVITLFSLKDRQSAQPGTCFLLTENGTVKTRHLSSALEPRVYADAQQALQTKAAATQCYEGFTGLVEVIAPAISLVILGAGNDILPLTHMAQFLGWEVTVIDGRARYATRERFPAAREVMVLKPDDIGAAVHWDERTAAVLMTHNYNYDLAALRQLLPAHPIPYIGLLGPKKKLQRMRDELGTAGGAIGEAQPGNVYAPVGLDIGAETADEIAVSVIAEIMAVFSGQKGSSLREKKTAIHSL